MGSVEKCNVEKNSHFFSSERHKNVEYGVHIHAEMEIVTVNSGVLTMAVDGREYEIPEGCGLIIPPFSPHAFHSKRTNLCHVFVFSEVVVPYFFEFIKENVPTDHLFRVSDAAAALCDCLLPHKQNSADYITAEAVLAPFCRDVYVGCTFAPRTRVYSDIFSKMIDYIKLHFAENIGLEDVAHAIGAHPVTLSKTCSKSMGVGFHYYLQYQRCAYAANLLRTSDMSVTEIALSSGFGSIRSFNRAFLQIYNMTPTEYKKLF